MQALRLEWIFKLYSMNLELLYVEPQCGFYYQHTRCAEKKGPYLGGKKCMLSIFGCVIR